MPIVKSSVIEQGELVFQLGDELRHVGPGDIVIAPPNVPHKFTNQGPDRALLVCIHATPKMVTEWLE